MTRTPASNTVSNAMFSLVHETFIDEPSTPTDEPATKKWRVDTSISETTTTTSPHASATTSGLGALIRLPPEIRNAIYALLLSSPSPFFIVPSILIAENFQLRENTDRPQQDVIATLQALSYVSREVREEARTYFYSTNHFIVLCYGYEYLPVFVQWLKSIGSECRAVLRTMMLHGYMWYQPSQQRTQRLHSLMRECSNVRHLTLQFNVRHFCEAHLPELNAYLNYAGPEPHDGPLPQVDLSTWTQTIANMSELRIFELDLILAADKENVGIGKERSVREFSEERGRVLALDVEQRLREEVREECKERGVAIRVRYRGGDERKYYLPWARSIGVGSVRK